MLQVLGTLQVLWVVATEDQQVDRCSQAKLGINSLIKNIFINLFSAKACSARTLKVLVTC
jgi:hypothetical protein